jgi:hypothetical protein
MIHITYKDVIGAMQNIESNLKVIDSQEVVKEIDDSIKSWKNVIKDQEKRGINDDWYMQDLLDEASRKSDTEDAIKAGFTKALIINFGDNHGDVCGGDVGNTMDYEGRNIHINKPDLIVTTEQNR